MSIDATTYPCPESEHGDTHHLVTHGAEGIQRCEYCQLTRDEIERSIAAMNRHVAHAPVPDKDELLTTDEVAEILKVDPNTLYRWRVAKQKLPFYKVGSEDRPLIRYRRSDVLAYLGQSRIDVGLDNDQNPPADG